MNKLMVWFQRQVRLPDGALNFREGHSKTDAASNSRVTMGDWLVWGQFLGPNMNKDTIGKLSSRAFDLCNKIWWFLCEIIQ
jgi:hypothetical protein